MIYNKPLLILKILFESCRPKPVFGIYRPQAYVKGGGSYCTVIRFEIFKTEILAGEEVVLDVVLEAPVGFGKKLKAGALLEIKDGLDLVKALVLEIKGYQEMIN